MVCSLKASLNTPARPRTAPCAARNLLLAFKRMQTYVDAGSPGRNWNDATAMLISDKNGMQIMGGWANGEFIAANQVAGQHYGGTAGLGRSPPGGNWHRLARGQRQGLGVASHPGARKTGHRRTRLSALARGARCCPARVS